MYKHKDIRVPGAGTHVKMHGLAKGPAAGPHIAKRLSIHIGSVSVGLVLILTKFFSLFVSSSVHLSSFRHTGLLHHMFLNMSCNFKPFGWSKSSRNLLICKQKLFSVFSVRAPSYMANTCRYIFPCYRSHTDFLTPATDMFLDIVHVNLGEQIRVVLTTIAAPACSLSFTGSVKISNFRLTEKNLLTTLYIDWHYCLLHYNEHVITLPLKGTAFSFQPNLLTSFEDQVHITYNFWLNKWMHYYKFHILQN